MSLLRYDVTTNDWVIGASERVGRPSETKKGSRVTRAAEIGCPFCPGQEYLTGPEVFAERNGTAPNTPGWSIRVVPNKFPALRIEDEHHRYEQGPLFHYMDGCGAHEVIIETPVHDQRLAMQSTEHVELVMRTLQGRCNDLLRDQRFQTIVIFKNHGERAGTSLSHPHWQLIAMPIVPRTLRMKYAVATDYFDQTGDCLYSVLLEQELAAGDRVVAENDHYAAIMPYASHVPFETWILPKERLSSFGRVEHARLRPLADLLRTVIMMLDRGLQDPDYNLTIHTAPRGDEDKSYFVWHIEIVPRLTRQAGFEQGSGMSINTVLPEDAAQFLRSIEAAAA